MRRILIESIDFSKSGDFTEDKLKMTVKKASINSESHVLTLEMELNFVLSPGTLAEVRDRIKRAVKDVGDIELNIEYKDVKGREVPLNGDSGNRKNAPCRTMSLWESS